MGLDAVERACASALAVRLLSADAVLNLLACGREPEPPPPVLTPASLTLGPTPDADYARYDGLRAAYDEVITLAAKRHRMSQQIAASCWLQLADVESRAAAYRMANARSLMMKTLSSASAEIKEPVAGSFVVADPGF